jgi:hypothetical protein
MGELSLRNYRANPSNRTFQRVAAEYRPWLYSSGMKTLNRFPTLSAGNCLDDLTNEGLLALSVSARRFVWFCRRCGEAFIQHGDLTAHAAVEHGVRGGVQLVKLDQFAECSARLAMRRTARRMLRPEEYPAGAGADLPDLLDEAWTEDALAAEILIRRAERRMSADARRILLRVLSSARPPLLAADDLGAAELRRLLADLSERTHSA